jgi:hypothetical protein
MQSLATWPATTPAEENSMNAADTKTAASLFSAVRRNRGSEVAVAGALLIAAYLGVASVLIDNYQRPDFSNVVARV